MNCFTNFLVKAKDFLRGIKSTYTSVHLVLGNESCDLDSTVSTLMLAYYLYINKNSLNLGEETVILPIINVNSKDFDLRTHTTFLLQESNINKNQLIYKNDINLNDLLKDLKVTTSLVDHHMLNNEDKILEKTVIQIIDHRPLDSMNKWNSKQTDINIQQVGSCATLVAQLMLDYHMDILDKPLAYLLYGTILFDTISLDPKNGRAQDLDIKIGALLEEKYCINEGREAVFDKLQTAFKDISSLSSKQLLSRDLKVVNSIPIPGLPMLVSEFLKRPDSYSSIVSFCEEYNSALVIIIGINYINNIVNRDIAIYWKNADTKNILLEMLSNSESLFGYNFGFSPINTNLENILCYKQNNIKLTRKQIIPIVKSLKF